MVLQTVGFTHSLFAFQLLPEWELLAENWSSIFNKILSGRGIHLILSWVSVSGFYLLVPARETTQTQHIKKINSLLIV